MNKKTLDPEASPQAAYGVQLRRSREAKGYTQAKLAADTPCDKSYISKLETASADPTKDLSERFDELLETGGTLLLMWRQWKETALIEGFPEYAKHEAKAALLRLFDVWAIPGLLEAKEYTAALMAGLVERGEITEEQASERLAFRLARQEILDKDPASTLHVVLGEGCLRRSVGDPDTLSGQFRHLESMGQRPNVTLQVLPFSSAFRSPFDMPIHLLTLHDRTSLGYTETIERGYIQRDRATVTRWNRYYDRLQAEALSPADSLALIRAVRKETCGHDRRDRTGARLLAQVQLQRPGRRRMR